MAQGTLADSASSQWASPLASPTAGVGDVYFFAAFTLASPALASALSGSESKAASNWSAAAFCSSILSLGSGNWEEFDWTGGLVSPGWPVDAGDGFARKSASKTRDFCTSALSSAKMFLNSPGSARRS